MYIKLSPEAKSMLKIYYEDYLERINNGEERFTAREINCKKLIDPQVEEQGFDPFMEICRELYDAKLMLFLTCCEKEVVLWAQLSEKAIKYMSERKR